MTVVLVPCTDMRVGTTRISEVPCTDQVCWCCSNAAVHPFTPVTGPSAWYAAQYKDSSEHVYNLTPQDLAELGAAVAGVAQSGKDIQASSPILYKSSTITTLPA